MLLHRRVTPSVKFDDIGIYTPGWKEALRGTMKVSCPRTNHNVPDQGSKSDIQPRFEHKNVTMRQPRFCSCGGMKGLIQGFIPLYHVIMIHCCISLFLLYYFNTNTTKLNLSLVTFIQLTQCGFLQEF